MEEGEIEASKLPANSCDVYDPAYEWPGDPSQVNQYVGPYESYTGAWNSPSDKTYSGTPDETADEYLNRHSTTEGTSTSEYSNNGGGTASSGRSMRSTTQHCLRFIVLRSGILPLKHRIILADGYPELQFGRDIQPTGSSTPRVRLKEMEVSKLHASVYWDGARKEWGVVDMGSKHGTFLKHTQKGSERAAVDSEDVGVRLSPPRVASMPRMLGHMDRLTIGSTTFVVHLHKDRMPCEGCSPANGEEVPLFPTSKASGSLKRSRTTADLESLPDSMVPRTGNPKEVLNLLKRSLLTRHGDTPKSESSTSSRSGSPSGMSKEYVDRSARRRALHTTSQLDAPGVPSLNAVLPSLAGKARPSGATSEPISLRATPVPGEATVSQPPTPLSNTNIGYRLLMGQGWEPGTTLGMAQDDTSEGRTALLEPLQLASSTNRAGLGMPTRSAPEEQHANSSQRERDKFRRWQEARLGSIE